MHCLRHEYETILKCKNPKTSQQLPYDNEVFINENAKLIIEVHGEQHYKINIWTKDMAKRKHIFPEEEFEYIKWKDQFKKEFALSQGYKYLEIPYWTDNNQTEWKTLIINKLEELQ